ncbi:MAG: hypothetical protein U0S36_04615 [Candidatus Nanopelagicales bacterium]
MAARVMEEMDVVDDQDVGRRAGRGGDVLEGGEQGRGVRRLLGRDAQPEPVRRGAQGTEGVEQLDREGRGLVTVTGQCHDGVLTVVALQQLRGER